MIRPSSIRRACLAAVLALVGACSSLGMGSGGEPSKPAQVPKAIEHANEAAQAGDTRTALDLVRRARKVDGLDASVRDELDVLIERYAAKRIDELSAPGSPPKELADMLELDLPQRLAVDAGVSAARLYLDQGKPYKAYSLLKKVETKYPRHHGKVEAGEILFEAGMKLADDPWSFMGMFEARDDGIEVLEYLVMTYPLERHCDEAFYKLAQMYEHDRLFELARERHEELLYSHIKSPLAAASEARIPHLRLAGLESPEYDRREMLKARDELEAWLKHHPGHELESQVRYDYADCLARLVENDLNVARFYRRIGQPFGARFHAARALTDAQAASDQRLVADATQLLATIPDVSALPGRGSQPGEDAFSTDPSLLRSLQQRTQDKEQATKAQTPPQTPSSNPAPGTPP